MFLTGLILFKFSLPSPQNIKLPEKNNYWGITYSKKFASSIGLDWKETYLALIDDLKVKTIRLPIYWDNIENKEGYYNYVDYDWILDEGNKRDVKFIIAIGRRLPRWPECHSPEWVKNYNETEIKVRIERMLRSAVKHYRGRSEIIAWQLENEPLLDSFGECPPGDYKFLASEFKTIKTLDKRPIVITGSGELSNWLKETVLGDKFGTTLYRTVWSPFFGYVHYPWPPYLYSSKAKQVGLKPEDAIIAELQAEPWAPNTTLDQLDPQESKKSFTINNFKSNLQYAADTGFGQVWLWGAEWWYMEKKRGNTQYWDLAKTLRW